MKVVTNDGVYFVRLGRYTYLPIRYYRDYRFLIQNQILNWIEKGALLSVSCFSILCAKPFTGVIILLKNNKKHDWQIR